MRRTWVKLAAGSVGRALDVASVLEMDAVAEMPLVVLLAPEIVTPGQRLDPVGTELPFDTGALDVDPDSDVVILETGQGLDVGPLELNEATEETGLSTVAGDDVASLLDCVPRRDEIGPRVTDRAIELEGRADGLICDCPRDAVVEVPRPADKFVERELFRGRAVDGNVGCKTCEVKSPGFVRLADVDSEPTPEAPVRLDAAVGSVQMLDEFQPWLV